MEREDKRQQNRERFPELAAFVDDLRAKFGDGVRVIHLEISGEGGR